MSEVLITFDKKNSGLALNEINIEANIEEYDENKGSLEYKFLEGVNGLWKPIQDFSNESICLWKPKKEGKYMIMVQARENNSKKSYNFLGRTEFEVVGLECKKIIEDIRIDKNDFCVGDKVNLEVVSSKDVALYRYSIKGEQDWELISDYSTDEKIMFTACKTGEQEILIECKGIESENNVDEFRTVKFTVKDMSDIEIINFECISESLLVNEELVFKVDTNYDDKRTMLYKFLKIDKNGKMVCLQDFSTNKIISYNECEAGEYKLLCLVRDMLSDKAYDDRAIIIYNVKAYEDIVIKKFTCDMNSPQLEGTKIKFDAIVDGGENVLYKYIVEGPISEESGYIRSNSFEWTSKVEGEYKVILKVRDLSYDGDYEDIKELTLTVQKKASKPVKICDISSSKTRKCIVGEVVNIKVNAEGGNELKYSFIVYKDSKEINRSPYCKNNWVNFTPEQSGEYEIEIRVIDKYSSKEYDSHSYIYFKVREYSLAEIDYVLVNTKDIYLVGDKIELETIIQDTCNNLLRYVTKINGREVEDTGYIKSRRIRVKPKCPGKYTFEIYAKNIKCKDDYDSKKEVNIYVHSATPIRETKLKTQLEQVEINKEVTFEVNSIGGKEVCYEFYLMEKDNWYRVQEYSRKNYYTFVPFASGEYRMLVFSKSFHKKCNYEDYASIKFNVLD